ncbi:MAG: bis(5'-nucleosyl)-tetraphosphatase (symmetrical) YqeK [Clostridia bacterium]|nr:bis(5'-nucleosyl)-tetraphosphatase (symmetrical) YqeK [Clostridia bacterium]
MELARMDLEAMEEKLKGMLTEKRYRHSIGVMETAVEMAEIFGVDVEKAQLAGLLHDCAKDIDKNKRIPLCKELGVLLDPVKKEQRGLIHADLGAKMLETEFGILDVEIIDAVKYHTLGRERMTDLEKILYLADIIEPNRTPFEGIEELRALCKTNLDCAMLFALERTIEYIQHRHKKLHSQTLQAQQYFLEICKEKVTG